MKGTLFTKISSIEFDNEKPCFYWCIFYTQKKNVSESFRKRESIREPKKFFELTKMFVKTNFV